jgi:hypothetical protein
MSIKKVTELVVKLRELSGKNVIFNFDINAYNHRDKVDRSYRIFTCTGGDDDGVGTNFETYSKLIAFLLREIAKNEVVK